MVFLFILVVLGLVCVFGPTPHSRHNFLSSSHRWRQMLLLDYVTLKLVDWLKECNKLNQVVLNLDRPKITEKRSEGFRNFVLGDLSDT